MLFKFRNKRTRRKSIKDYARRWSNIIIKGLKLKDICGPWRGNHIQKYPLITLTETTVRIKSKYLRSIIQYQGLLSVAHYVHPGNM